jgi:hypothetical protein
LMTPKDTPPSGEPIATAVDPGHPEWDQAAEATVEKVDEDIKVTETKPHTKAKWKKKSEPVEDAADTAKNIFQKEDTVEIK